MITIEITEDNDRLFLEASGHALSDTKGKDLICCGISVLLQAMELNFPEDSKRGEGYQRIEVKGPTAEQKIVWDAYIDPVIMFAKDFPENIFLKNIQFGGE